MARYNSVLLICLVSTFHLVSADPAAPLDVECPEPYREIGGACLFFNVLGSGSWHDMKSICEDLNGHLVKIDHADLLYDIVNFIKDEAITQDHFWIGANDEGLEGDWRWHDDSIVKMGTPFWGTVCDQVPEIQEPRNGESANCAVISNEYLYFFHDWPCTKVFASICEHGW